MRQLVHVQPSFAAAEKMDSAGGPGALFKTVAERFRPEAFYVEAGRRAAFWVIDFKDAAAVAELTHLMLANCGVEPTLTPVLTADEAPAAIGAAFKKARS